MRSLRLIPALTLTVALVACQSSVVPDTTESVSSEQSSSVATEVTVFTGTRTGVDLTQSSITFVGGSDIIDHDGGFNTFTVTITPDATTPSDFTKASVEATIDVASVYTDSNGLTGHLQREDFFDVANHPQVTFTSTEIVKTGDTSYDITGDLTVKGVTKQVTFDAEVSDTAVVAMLDLPRRDFGIGNDHYGDKLLDETVPVIVTATFAQ